MFCKAANKPVFVAIDLGASNGRVMAGTLDGYRLGVREIHRFEHCAAPRAGRLRWDWPMIQAEIRRGLAMLPAPQSVSCDSWAQDFGLLDESGALFYAPVSYRDSRTHGMPASFRAVIVPEELVRRAGVGAVNITTLCQLRAMALQEPAILARARVLLHMADLVHYDLCGVAATDWTMASAAQLCSRRTGQWDRDLAELLGIPSRLLPPLRAAPVVLGQISAARAPTPAWAGVPVVLGAGHDTPCAFHVMPASEPDTLFISCGTWIMLGIRLADTMPSGMEAHGTLMGLPGGGWGLWRGGLGLWFIQECRRTWRAAGRDWTPVELAAVARASHHPALLALHDPRLLAAAAVPDAVRTLCLAAGQPTPVTPGDTARIIYRSLAQACADDMRVLATARGRPFRRVRLVGGGARNEFLCQLIADACALPVDAGPFEATTAGNLLLQIQALEGWGTAQIDAVRTASFAVKTYKGDHELT